jgi:hypothetical protein
MLWQKLVAAAGLDHPNEFRPAHFSRRLCSAGREFRTCAVRRSSRGIIWRQTGELGRRSELTALNVTVRPTRLVSRMIQIDHGYSTDVAAAATGGHKQALWLALSTQEGRVDAGDRNL